MDLERPKVGKEGQFCGGEGEQSRKSSGREEGQKREPQNGMSKPWELDRWRNDNRVMQSHQGVKRLL